MADQKDNGEQNVLEYVTLGDLVIFSVVGTSAGTMIGDTALGRVGVQVAARGGAPSLQQHECAFEICPMLSYHAMKELRREMKEVALAAASNAGKGNDYGDKDGDGADSDAMKIEEVRKSMRNEAEQNALALNERRGEIVNYGDIVQLRHCHSDLYLKMRGKRAALDKDCKSVSLASGSLSSYFRLSPRFKTRSMGTPVYFDDEVLLTSVKYDLLVHASRHKCYPTSVMEPEDELADSDALGVPLPRSLTSPPTREVNGSRDFYSFKIGLYSRTDLDDPDEANALRTQAMFRLFHPEADAFLQASGDPEKGGGENAVRIDGITPSHIPYLKYLDGLDTNNAEHLSSKGLWVFENVNRSVGSCVPFNRPVRIRHSVSGKYLTCKTSSPAPTSGTGGVLSKGSFLLGMCFDVDKSAKKGDFASEKSLEFYIYPAEKTDEDNLPSSASTIRIEHRHIDGRPLHLHHTTLEKISLSKNSIAKSQVQRGTGIVFSYTQHAEDMLKLIPSAMEEMVQVNRLVSRRLVLDITRWRMENAVAVPSADFTEPCVTLMLSLMDDLTRGGGFGEDLHKLTTSEWIKKANSMLPTKFSALFMGKAVEHIQDKFVDCKLMDVVFNLSLAPYNRFLRVDGSGAFYTSPPESSDISPWDFHGSARKVMEKAKALQKLAHVVIQKAFQANDDAKEYFARRTSRMLIYYDAEKNDGGEAPTTASNITVATPTWVKIIASQSEDPLGATVTLSALVVGNERLMGKVVDETLLKKLCQLIQDRGPQPRFMRLFESICTTQGRPIVSNQEATLRLLWMNADTRRKTLVEIVQAEADSTKTVTGPFADQGGGAPMPSDFLGYEETSKGRTLPALYCQWQGTSEWKDHMEDLFWDAKSMGVTEELNDGGTRSPSQRGVRLESLCWVLSPSELCEGVTGRRWEDMNPENAGKQKGNGKSPKAIKRASSFGGPDKEAELIMAKFKRHNQLADWLVAQLKLYKAMCTGRSYNVIAILEKSFTYPMLLSMLFNALLPGEIRACALDLVRCLFVDRYPQLKHSGKPVMPQKLWVFDDPKGDGSDQGSSVALVRPRKLDDNDALPGFRLRDEHEFVTGQHKDNKVLSFQTDTKFFLLRKMTNAIIKGSAGSLVYSRRDVNSFLSAGLEVSRALLAFGFQSTYGKLLELCGVVGELLDGRDDFAKPGLAFNPRANRYADSGGNSLVVAHLKVTAIGILMDVSDLRADYRLGQMLWLFKDKYYKILSQARSDFRPSSAVAPVIDASRPAEPTSPGSPTSPVAPVQQNGNRPEDLQPPREKIDDQEIFDEFEALFEPKYGADAPKLDLGALTGQPVGDILKDCLMYEDDELFKSALALLDRRFGQRRKLLSALADVKVLENAEIDVFGTVNSMLGRIEYLIFVLRSTQQWGVKSRLSGDFDHARFQFLRETSRELLEFLRRELDADELRERQEILSSASLSATLSEGFRIDPNLSFKGSICTDEDKLNSQNMLLESVLGVLQVTMAYVKGNSENQQGIFAHVGSLCKVASLELVEIENAKENYADLCSRNHELCRQVREAAKSTIMKTTSRNVPICKELASSSSTYHDVFATFARDLCAAEDPSALETELSFFLNVINPEGNSPLKRNQDYVTKLFMRTDHAPIRKALRASLSADLRSHALSKPWKLITFLCKLVDGHNTSVAEKFGSDFFTTSDESNEDGDDEEEQSTAVNVKVCLAFMSKEFSLYLGAGGASGGEEEKSDGPTSIKVQRANQSADKRTMAKCLEALATFTVKLLEITPAVDPDMILSSKDIWYLLDEGLTTLFERCITGMTQRDFPVGLVSDSLEILDALLKSAAASSLLETMFDDHRDTMERLAKLANDIFAEAPLNAGNSSNDIFNNLTLKAYHVLITLGNDVEKPASNRKTFFKAAKQASRIKTMMAGSIGVKKETSEFPDLTRNITIFKGKISDNPLIKEQIRQRKFMLVETLEKAIDDTCPKWDDIVKRFGRYGMRNYDRPQSSATMVKIFDTLYFSLVKLKDGKEEVDAAHLKQYVARQSGMVRDGICKLVFLVLCHSSPSWEQDTVCSAAFRLGLEMLNGGNEDVQKQIGTMVRDLDVEGLFHEHLKQRVLMLRNVLVQNRDDKLAAVAHGENVSDFQPDKEFVAQLVHGEETFNLMQLLVEGHNAEMQELLRLQPTHIGSINLLKEAIETIFAMCPNPQVLGALSKVEIDLAQVLLDFLAECCYGPSPDNQEEIVKSDAIIAVKNIINMRVKQSNADPLDAKATDAKGMSSQVDDAAAVNVADGEKDEEKDRALVTLRVTGVSLLTSLFEGRRDHHIAEIMAGKLEPIVALFSPFQKFLKNSIKEKLQDKTTDLDDEDTKDMIDLSLSGMAMLKTVMEALKLGKSGDDAHESKQPLGDDDDGMVGSVDICWNGVTNKSYFPMPVEKDCLTGMLKNEILAKVDVTLEHDRRMKEVLFYSQDVSDDLKIINRSARKNWIYRTVHENTAAIRNTIYVFVILLNFNVVMSSKLIRSPIKVLFYCGHNDYVGEPGNIFCSVYDDYRYNLAITFIFGLMIMIGYIVMIITHGMTEIPSEMSKVRARLEADKKRMADKGEKIAAFDATPLVGPALFAFLTGLLMMELYAAYRTFEPMTTMLCCVIILVWTFKAIRRAIVLPTTVARFSYVVFYNAMIDRAATRNHLLLLGVLAAGFYNHIYFTFLLFDIFNISEDLSNILSAVTDSTRGLLLVGFLILCSLVVYATLGSDYYPGDFGDGEDDAYPGFSCQTPMECLVFIGLMAFPGGDISGIMSPTELGAPRFYGRMLYDLSFFIWIGILLFNIITGLVLDRFASRRERSQRRRDVMENQCLVCGISRVRFKDLGLPPGDDSFEHHIEEEHSVWNYLFFVHYLLQKDEGEYTGLETFVVSELKTGRYSWLPKASSHTIEKYTRGGLEEESLSDQVVSLTTRLGEMQERMEDFEENMAAKLDQLLRASKGSDAGGAAAAGGGKRRGSVMNMASMAE